MKTYTSLCIYLFALFSISLYANSPEPESAKKGTISGVVLDAKLQQPLPYVNIIIKDANSKTLTGGITADDGTFKIEKIMELIKAVFPYASPEIVSPAIICFFMTLFGLSVGFALLKVQGE